ncbi:hypothetical protein SynSYN20_00223 [Synechococcus sp. SYN20]|nr:hypothetical protein SynSYN20_00223 [Synechococcus sp. SYN20]
MRPRWRVVMPDIATAFYPPGCCSVIVYGSCFPLLMPGSPQRLV